MQHRLLAEALRPSLELLEAVRKKALMRLRYENAERMPELSDPTSRFFNDPAGFALSRYAYYQCHKCRKPYFGGMAHCALAGGGAFRAEDLVCSSCLPHASEASCAKHGADFIQFKCAFCCGVAVFFCFGTTHFCGPCHDRPGEMQEMKRKGTLPACPAAPLGKPLKVDPAVIAAAIASGMGPGSGAPTPGCPLLCCHPPTGDEFCLGCSICREAATF